MNRDTLAQRLANAVLRTVATREYCTRLGATFVLGVNEVNRLAALGKEEQERYLTDLSTIKGLRKNREEG